MSKIKPTIWVNVPFESERLSFREISFQDAPKIVEWRRNEAINKFFVNQVPITLESQSIWYDAYLKNVSRFDYMIICKDSGLDIGTVGVVNISNTNKDLEVSYMIGDVASHKCGFASEAVAAVIGLAKNLGFRMVRATVHQKNIPSIRLVEKLGFDLSGATGEFRTYEKTLCDQSGR